MTQHVGELTPPVRLMLTPGPSSVDPRVYRAMATPLVGHMDPWFKGCMDETQILLRQIFQTENRITMPLSASGSGGIEQPCLTPWKRATKPSLRSMAFSPNACTKLRRGLRRT